MAKSEIAPATFAVDEKRAEGESVPVVVSWEGDDDIEKPTNWSVSKKWINVLLISTLTLIS